MGRIDIGNVRGIKGDKGDKGEQGQTPSYEDLKYKKLDGNFVILKTTNFTQSEYYLDVNGNLCNSEGYLYDDDSNLTNEIGTPFDTDVYDYDYKPLYVDSDGNFTNSSGELLDENWEIQYVPSDFISDVVSFIFNDIEGYTELLKNIAPYVANSILSVNPNDLTYKSFFDAIEGDIKYYVCIDNPKTSIYLDGNDDLVNNCKYYDDDGNIAKDTNNNYLYVPLEKNALYLYNSHGIETNEIMLYDIYLCTKVDTVPKKLLDSNDFTIDYNVIDDLKLTTPNPSANEGEQRLFLELLTRGTRGQFYSMDDVDTLITNNVINKKSSNITTDTGSTVKFPTVKAVEDYVEDIIGDIEEDLLS